MTTNIPLPGLGVIPKPRTPKDHIMLAFAAEAPVYDWSQAFVDDGEPQSTAFGIIDKDQGSGGSCTCQSTGYGMFKTTGDDISRHDPYSHVHMPAGGAYLNAPLDWFINNGYVLLSKYPDPNPQTEANMQETFIVKDGDRIRTFELKYKVSPVTSIDAAAIAIQNYDFVIMGIWVDFSNGWNGSWTDPLFKKTGTGHSILAGQAVIRKGKKAIKAKSSWTTHRDYLSKPSYVHFINEDYFNNGGAFDIIGVNVKELTEMPNQKFTVKVGDALGVLEVTPEGYITGKLAVNPTEYSQQGKQLGIQTCDVDQQGNASNFGPTNFTKTA